MWIACSSYSKHCNEFVPFRGWCCFAIFRFSKILSSVFHLDCDALVLETAHKILLHDSVARKCAQKHLKYCDYYFVRSKAWYSVVVFHTSATVSADKNSWLKFTTPTDDKIYSNTQNFIFSWMERWRRQTHFACGFHLRILFNRICNCEWTNEQISRKQW